MCLNLNTNLIAVGQVRSGQLYCSAEVYNHAGTRADCRSWVIRSIRCLHTCLRGRSMVPIFDHRETVMGLCRLARTVCERVGERWRDGAGCCLTSTLWPTRNQQTPYQCAHRMQISSTHRDEFLKSHAKTARGLSKAS